MYKELLSTYKDSLIYSLGNMANKVIGFILIPLYTYYIPLKEYGELGLIEPLVQLFFITLGLGINSAFLRWYSIEKSEEEKKKIFFNVNLLLIINTLIIVIILILLSDYISQFLFHNLKNSMIIKIAFANVFFLVVNPIIFSTLRVQGRPGYYSFVRSFQFAINLGLNVFFIAYLHYGIMAIFLGQLISSSLLFIYFIPFFIKHSKMSIQFNLIKVFLKFGIPLIFVGIAQLIIIMLNRYILEYYQNIETVGLFSFAFKLSNTLKIVVIESLTLGLSPILYKKLSGKNGKRFMQQNYKYVSFIVLFIYIFFSSFSREFIYFAAKNKDYYDAYLLTPLLGGVYIFNVINYFHFILLGYAKKTSITAIITIVTAIISIVINFILISRWGVYGAGVAIMLSSAFTSFLLNKNITKLHGKYFDNNKIFILISVSTLIITVNFSFFMEIYFINSIIKFFICSLFPFIIYFFGFYESVEILKIKELYGKYIRFIK